MLALPFFGLIVFLPAFVIAQEKAATKSIKIRQEINFEASPESVYHALLDSKQFTDFSGRTAEINATVVLFHCSPVTLLVRMLSCNQV